MCSTGNCAELTTELLAEAFAEAFDGHFAAQTGPLRIHKGIGCLFGGGALHSDNTSVGKSKVENPVGHCLLLRARILKRLARSRATRCSRGTGSSASI